jgi:hypothetical protein
VVDYHVDRPEVEAPQGVELTGTNRSEILTKVLVTLEVLLCTDCKVCMARFPHAIGSSYGSPSRRGIPKKLKSFWRPWRRGTTRSHPEHGS